MGQWGPDALARRASAVTNSQSEGSRERYVDRVMGCDVETKFMNPVQERVDPRVTRGRQRCEAADRRREVLHRDRLSDPPLA